jgi:SAM-dependent methyltransferase
MFDRKAHWENVYGDKSPLEVSWYQKEPTLSLSLIRNTGLAHDAPVIDVGGGASILVDCLCDEGYEHVGVLDISGKALAHARHRLGEKAKTVEWYEEDVTLFRPPHRFALWHDRAVFHFLTEAADRRKYVETLKHALRPGGHLILAAFAIGGPTQCSGLDIVQYDAEKLMAELGEDFELIEESNELHMTPANREQQFTYFHCILKAEHEGA